MGARVIHAEGLGKRYTIGRRFDRYRTLRDTLAESFGRRRGGVPDADARDAGGPDAESFWALREASFEIGAGEVVGVIGGNGAGKSTLLRILSRITVPTQGRAEIRGRVGSLLEVGTGFHPELSGRENTFLNGAILGMRRAEIERKFDEIVEFAGVARFIDTPVKRYSSGMYLRLAFAVAAHLEPEILLVDEVLAVGDAAFQAKCLGKLDSIAHAGRTVLLVSHNMAAIQSLCARAIVVDHGRIAFDGDASDAIARYLAANRPAGASGAPGEHDLEARRNPYRPGTLLLRRVVTLDERGSATETILLGRPLTIAIDVEGLAGEREAVVGIKFRTDRHETIAYFNTAMRQARVADARADRERIVLHLPRVPFVPGTYWLDLSVFTEREGRLDYIERAASFVVGEADVYGAGYRVREGLVFLDAEWERRAASAPAPAGER